MHELVRCDLSICPVNKRSILGILLEPGSYMWRSCIKTKTLRWVRAKKLNRTPTQ